MRTTIAVLDGGLHHRKAFSSFNDNFNDIVFVPVHKAASKPLAKYDIIVVPFHTDQMSLSRLQPKLETYVQKGGVLVILGATEDSGHNWLPFCRWANPYPEDIIIKEQDSLDGNILFRGIKCSSELKYHSFAAHGAFLQPSDKPGDCILASSQTGRAILLIRRYALGGTFLCTTLDPDYHSVTYAPCHDNLGASQIHERAALFLRNIMEWAQAEAKTKSQLVRRWNKFCGTFGLLTRCLIYWALLLLPAAFLAYKNTPYTDSSNALSKPVGSVLIVIAIIGLAGSIASIWQGWRDWKFENRRQ